MCRTTTTRLRVCFNCLFTVKSFFAVLFPSAAIKLLSFRIFPQQPPNFNYNTVKSWGRTAHSNSYRAAEHVQYLCKSASDVVVIDFSRAMGAIVAPIISPSARYLGTGPPWPPIKRHAACRQRDRNADAMPIIVGPSPVVAKARFDRGQTLGTRRRSGNRPIRTCRTCISVGDGRGFLER